MPNSTTSANAGSAAVMWDSEAAAASSAGTMTSSFDRATRSADVDALRKLPAPNIPSTVLDPALNPPIPNPQARISDPFKSYRDAAESTRFSDRVVDAGAEYESYVEDPNPPVIPEYDPARVLPANVDELEGDDVALEEYSMGLMLTSLPAPRDLAKLLKKEYHIDVNDPEQMAELSAARQYEKMAADPEFRRQFDE